MFFPVKLYTQDSSRTYGFKIALNRQPESFYLITNNSNSSQHLSITVTFIIYSVANFFLLSPIDDNKGAQYKRTFYYSPIYYMYIFYEFLSIQFESMKDIFPSTKINLNASDFVLIIFLYTIDKKNIFYFITFALKLKIKTYQVNLNNIRSQSCKVLHICVHSYSCVMITFVV